MCYSAFLMCAPVMICDSPPHDMLAAVTCTVQVSTVGPVWRRERSDCTCQLDCWLLIWSFYFQNTAQGKGICVWLSLCSREMQSKSRDGRGWEWRQTTHHLIMLECATALCIFLVTLVVRVVFVQSVCAERAFQAARSGASLTGREKNDLVLGSEICEIAD